MIEADSKFLGYVPTPHPVMPSPTLEDIKRMVAEHGA